MCGIIGYVGPSQAQNFILDGLATLEYRGYDSAGLVYIQNNVAHLFKTVSRVEKLRELVNSTVPTASALSLVSERPGSTQRAVPRYGEASTGLGKPKIDKKAAVPLASPEGRPTGAGVVVGIGHTRWATHGAPLERNSHPHTDTNKQFYVVHNGIVENFQELKTMLIGQGVEFKSDTDTEVIPQLIAKHYAKSGDVKEAFLKTIRSLKGAYSVVMVTPLSPDTMYAARLSSPLVIGIGKKENFIASDPTPIMEHTKKVIFLNDYEAAIVTPKSCDIFHIEKGKLANRQPEELEYDPEQALLGDFPNFMLKEVYEAPQTVRSALLGRLRVEQNLIKLGGLDLVNEQLRYIDRIIIVACGTSYYASLVGEYLIEEIAGIPVEVQQASEFKYRVEPLSRSTMVIAVSQSGETADTLAALEKVAGYGVLRIGVVNAVGSSIARVTDAGVYCHAGSEQSVASTKAFIAQVTVLSLIALHLSGGNSPLYKKMIAELDKIPAKIEAILKLEPQIKKLAKKYAHHRDFLYIGRRYMYPVALEGALKLKELSYIHAEGFAGGEMKHGPLAMIDENFPTMALALDGELFEKTMSNIQEIKARGGPVIAITNDPRKLNNLADDVIEIPKTIEQLQPLLAAIPLQLFAYHAALALNRNVDRPRNLAKSVTVE